MAAVMDAGHTADKGSWTQVPVVVVRLRRALTPTPVIAASAASVRPMEPGSGTLMRWKVGTAKSG